VIDLETPKAGFPKPKYNASFGQTLTQSMHFMQPESTTMPYCFTSASPDLRTSSINPNAASRAVETSRYQTWPIALSIT
jgi:hypothetical protein